MSFSVDQYLQLQRVADLRTGAGKQPQMRRTCDNKQTNIETEALRIVHCSVLFCLLHHAYKRKSRFIETWSGEAIGKSDSIVCIFVDSVVKWRWITAHNLSERILDWCTLSLKNLGGFHEAWRYG